MVSVEKHESSVKTRVSQAKWRLPIREFWSFEPLPRFARLSLLAVVAAALLAQVLLDWGAWSLSLHVVLSTVSLMGFALFAWKPPVAGALIAGLCATELAFGGGGAQTLFVAIAMGLVVVTCSTPFIVLYAVAVVFEAVGAQVVDPSVVNGGAFGFLTVALTSGLIGYAFRRAREREHDLNEQLAGVVRLEQDRIADELHDIVAHDLTVVVMHSRALRLSTDPVDRERSLDAVTRAAEQALTDTRRILRIVHEPSALGGDGEPEVVRDVLKQIEATSQELQISGIEVDVAVPEALNVSGSVETALWHAFNESTTNILKHASSTSSVRIALFLSESEVSMTIWNAGDSAPSGATTGGYGLMRMTERVALLGGTISAGPVDDGWRVDVTLPRT